MSQFNTVTALPREIVGSACLYPLIFFRSLCLGFIWLVTVFPMGCMCTYMFLFLSWPTGRARFPAPSQKADNIGSCTLRVFKASPRSWLVTWIGQKEFFYLYCFSSVFSVWVLPASEVSTVVQHRDVDRSRKDTFPRHGLISLPPPAPRQNNAFSYAENYSLMPPTNSFFPHVLWSQDPDLTGLENRRKKYGHKVDAMPLLFWTRLMLICISDITISVDWCYPQHHSYYFLSVSGLELLICASSKTPVSHGNSGVLLGCSWDIVFWIMNSEPEFDLWTSTSC